MDTVETAQSKGTFDLLSFVKDTAYPTKDVVVYQDAEAADKYVVLVEQRLEFDKNKNTVESDKLTEEIDKLGKRIADSAITFKLRGLPPTIANEIVSKNKFEDDDASEDAVAARVRSDNELIARTIIAVTNASGESDSRVLHGDDIAVLRGYLKEGEFKKIVQGVINVNFNAAVFDRATDAGFSSGSFNLAE